MNKLQRIGLVASAVAIGVGGGVSQIVPSPAPKVWMETLTAEVETGGRVTYQTERNFEHVSVTTTNKVHVSGYQVGDNEVEVDVWSFSGQRVRKGTYVTVVLTFSR
jgi:hypothetical protein